MKKIIILLPMVSLFMFCNTAQGMKRTLEISPNFEFSQNLLWVVDGEMLQECRLEQYNNNYVVPIRQTLQPIMPKIELSRQNKETQPSRTIQLISKKKHTCSFPGCSSQFTTKGSVNRHIKTQHQHPLMCSNNANLSARL